MRIGLALLSILLCLIAAFVPAAVRIDVADGSVKEVLPGFGAVIMSCICAGSPSGLANILYVLGLVFVLFARSRRWSNIAAGLLIFGLLLAASFLLLYNHPVLGDEAGVSKVYLRPRFGFYLWLASFAIAIAAAFIPRPPRPAKVIAQSLPVSSDNPSPAPSADPPRDADTQ